MQYIHKPYLQDNQGKQGSHQKGDNLGMTFWEKKKHRYFLYQGTTYEFLLVICLLITC